VAQRLNVSQATVYALIASGRLRHHRVGMGRGVIRVDEEQLADYLRESEPAISAAPAPARHVRLKHLRLS
jgi:excisionase family DNA binding protein